MKKIDHPSRGILSLIRGSTPLKVLECRRKKEKMYVRTYSNEVIFLTTDPMGTIWKP